MYFAYVIKSKRFEWYYKGLSDDVDRRFDEHNSGLVKVTKFYAPFRLVHVEIVETLKEARTMEKFFKSGYGREIIKEIDVLE
ncbi:MAG TPA: GIY-YIG nuclease family protein [Patescibacteria group bacterium]